MHQSKITRKRNFLNPSSGADCKFLVGTKNNEEEIFGHKAIFANMSPVFNNMFFGTIPEQGDEIRIPDIQPEAFHTLLSFLYSGEIKITSVEHALQVWYTAHKYDIDILSKYTIEYLINNVTPTNVCYILEFAISFENEFVMNFCQKIINKNISTVLNDPSFLEVDLSVLNFILDQNDLKVSEVDLFKALVRYKNSRENILEAESSTSPGNSSNFYERDENVVNSYGEGSSNQEGTETRGNTTVNCNDPLRELVKKIRFLTMTPEEFGECLGTSSLLSTSEILSILLNISVPNLRTNSMPEGFSIIKKKRKQKTDDHCNKQYYCKHAVKKCYSNLNTTDFEGCLNFKTNTNILITGIQIVNPTKSINNSRITSHGTIEILKKWDWENVSLFSHKAVIIFKRDSFVEIPFRSPFYINAKISYIIRVKFQNAGPFYSYKCLCLCKENNVTFQFKSFNQEQDICKCNGLIRSIVFKDFERTDFNNG